jgi:hypothetical protein
MVLMSAVIPAPDEGSKPAIVSTTGGVTVIFGHCKPKVQLGIQHFGVLSIAEVRAWNQQWPAKSNRDLITGDANRSTKS